MNAVALSALVLAAACVGRAGEVSASGGGASAADSPPNIYDRQRERLLKEKLEAEAQQRESLDGLTEDELFKEFDEALSTERRSAVLRKIRIEGSLKAADRLEDLAVRIRAGDVNQRKGQPLPSATGLEYLAEEIRFRQTGDRKHRARAWLIMTNPADKSLGRSVPRLNEIVLQGIVEVRGNLAGLADRGSDHDKEVTRRAIMMLDIWEQAKTPEETFVRAVEQDQYLPLRPCGVDYLLTLDSVSDSTRERVRKVLMPGVEVALLHRKKLEAKGPDGTSESTRVDERIVVCALYGFWAKHAPQEFGDNWDPLYFWCGDHFEPGARVSLDGGCP